MKNCKFRFVNAKHTTIRRGVHVWGQIVYDNNVSVVVGTFEQQPYAACLCFFTVPVARTAFAVLAKKLKLHETDLAEKLLTECEQKMIDDYERKTALKTALKK